MWLALVAGHSVCLDVLEVASGDAWGHGGCGVRTGYSRVPWGWPRRVLVVVVAVFLAPVFAVVSPQPEAAFGLGVPSASFNVAWARTGTSLVLTAAKSTSACPVTRTAPR